MRLSITLPAWLIKFKIRASLRRVDKELGLVRV